MSVFGFAKFWREEDVKRMAVSARILVANRQIIDIPVSIDIPNLFEQSGRFFPRRRIGNPPGRPLARQCHGGFKNPVVNDNLFPIPSEFIPVSLPRLIASVIGEHKLFPIRAVFQNFFATGGGTVQIVKIVLQWGRFLIASKTALVRV